MSGYGFGKKPAGGAKDDGAGESKSDRLDLTGIERKPVVVDPAREEAALARGAALGFVDRSPGRDEPTPASTTRRRRRPAQPQASVFIKGPQDTLDWFVEYTNQRGHRSYWEALEEFRAMVKEKG